MQAQDSKTGKEIWVRPEVTGTASLQEAQAQKYYTAATENNVNQTGPAS